MLGQKNVHGSLYIQMLNSIMYAKMKAIQSGIGRSSIETLQLLLRDGMTALECLICSFIY